MKKSELVSVLTTVSKALDKNNVIPIYNYLCFTGDTVFAFSDNIGVVSPFKTRQPFAVHGPTFLKLISASISDNIDMEVTREGLMVKAGESEYTMPIKGPDEFVWKEPDFKSIPLSNEVIVGITKCLPTCSENLALEAFNRVCVKADPVNHNLNIYATDGDALTKYSTNTIIKGEEIDFCMSQIFCDAVKDPEESHAISIDEKHEWVIVSCNGTKIYGPNLGNTTLNYEEQITKSLGKKVSDDLSELPYKLLDQALTRARVVADIESSPTKIIVEGNEMIIQTQTPFGDVFDSLKVEHKNIEIDVNAALIQNSIQGCTHFKLTEQSCLFTGEKVLRLVSTIG